MKRNKITLHDIAKEAHTHVSTVSKALRNSSDINSETCVRIAAIAKQLGYTIPPQKIKTPKKKLFLDGYVVGVICPEIKSNFYAKIVEAIDENCRQRGATLHFAFSNFDPADEQHHVNNFIKSGVNGIIFISESRDFDQKLLVNKKIPFVIIAPEPILPEYDNIKIDDNLGVSIAVEHLIELGHKDIGYIGDILSDDRLSIFKKTLRINGIHSNPELIQTRQERFEECGYLGVKDLLAQPLRPTALFAAYDDIAVGALKALQEAGIRVPEEMSIIGIDDIQVSPYLHSALTTVGCPLADLGRIVTELVMEKITNPENTLVQHITLKPVLVIRESTSKREE